MYALFEGDRQIGSAFPTEKEVWEAALIEGLVMDVPVADEEGGQVVPNGYHVATVERPCDPRPATGNFRAIFPDARACEILAATKSSRWPFQQPRGQ